MKKASILLFFLACLLPALLLAAGYQGPNYEKRALREMPAFVEEGRVNLAFPGEFEDFLSDRFAFKPLLVSANAALNYYLLGDSSNEKVIAGRDGWLFLAETLDDYQRVSALSDGELARLCRTLALQQEYLQGRGIAFLFAAAPNKSTVYGEYMPARYATPGGDGPAAQLNRALGAAGVNHTDLLTALSDAKEGGRLYHKKDTHWNALGAWVGYREMLGNLARQNPAVPDVSGETASYTVEKTWYGDLETMLMPAFRLTDEQAAFGRPQNYAAERPMRSPEDIDITTHSDANGLNVLMFRDSFANALLPFLSNAFGTVHYTRAVPYDYALLEEDRPDIVIVEIVERNLRNLLEKAPLMPAPLRDIGGPVSTADSALGEVRAEPEGQYTRIHGWAVDGNGLPGDEVYVEIHTDGKRFVFEPFPIYDASFGRPASGDLPERAAYDGGFTMLLDGDALAPGTYGVRVLVKKGGAWSVLGSPATITR